VILLFIGWQTTKRKIKMTTQFRAQLPTEVIISIDEKWNEEHGSFEVATGFDKDGNAISLCNRLCSFAFTRTVLTQSELKALEYKKLIAKRQAVLTTFVATNRTERGFIMAVEKSLEKLRYTVYLNNF
jgi:hypothetical protein